MAENLEENASLVVSAVNEATATLQDIQKGFEDFEKSASSLGITSVALGGILKDITMKAFEELKDMVKLGIDEAIEAEQIQVKLANSFKAEGAAAAGSVASINEMSNSLGELVGVDNDVIAATATTLRQIGGLSAEMINKAMPAIADLSIRTGSLESAAMTVTRALNGQTRGLKMLGIEFEATGDKGADLEVLLGKVNEKFGGDAQAMMATAGGKLGNLKVVFTDIAQEIGNAVIQSDLFQDAISLITGQLLSIKAAIDPQGMQKFQLALDNAAKAAKGLSTETKILSEGVNPDLFKDFEAEAKTAFDKKKELTLEQLEAQLKALEAEVAAEEEASAARIQAAQEAAAIQTLRTDLLIEQDERLKEESGQIWTEMTDAQKQSVQDALDVIQYGSVFAAEVARASMTEAAYAISAAFQGAADMLGQVMATAIRGGSDMTSKLKEIWRGFGDYLLDLLARLIARLIVFNALSSLLGPGGTIFGMGAKALMGFQTPEGSTRVIPGPPNIAVPVMGHGGETIGRPESGGSGGLQVVVQGDYYESEEANERLFDRLYKYQKRTGVSLVF